MAERKAVNKYYPPDWDPLKGSVNKHVGQHPLRERARKLSQGILIIRFEMPYNIWCGGCGNHIGMGVRYNAEKKKVGNYYTTPIYRFRMKCHLCDNYMEIETDPKNCDYTIVSGARRKEERWDPSATENVQATDHAEKQKLIDDAMYKLEHGEKDKRKSKAAIPGLALIKDMQSQWKDDFGLNQMLRKKFRQEKKVMLDKEENDQKIKDKGSLDLELVDEDPEDVKLAQRIRFRSAGFKEDQRKRRLQIKARPMFKDKGTSNTNTRRSSLLEKRQRMAITKPSVGITTSPLMRDSSTIVIKRKEYKTTPVNCRHENKQTELGTTGDESDLTSEMTNKSQSSQGICHDIVSTETLGSGKLVDGNKNIGSDLDDVFVTRSEPRAVKAEMSIKHPLGESTLSSRDVLLEKDSEKATSRRKISLISEIYSDTDSDSSK